MPLLARAPPVGPASLAQFGAAAPGPVEGPPVSARAFGMPRAPNAHVLIHDQTSLEVVLPGGPIDGSPHGRRQRAPGPRLPAGWQTAWRRPTLPALAPDT